MNYKETYQEWLSNPYFDEDTKKEMNEEINKDTNGKADADTEINIEISSENLHLVLLDFVESSVLVSTV